MNFSPLAVRGLTFRYASSLLIFAMLLVIAYFARSAVIAGDQDAATILDRSGRQRILSQRIALNLVQLVGTADPAVRSESRRQLLALLNSLALSHDALTGGPRGSDFTGRLSAGAAAIYFHAPHQLDARMREFITAAQRLALLDDAALSAAHAEAGRLIASADGPLLVGLEAVVRGYERDSRSNLAQLRLTDEIFLVIALLLLLFIGLFVFRPLAAAISAETGRLCTAQTELAGIIETVAEAIIVFDADGIIRRANGAAERLWGSVPGGLLGTTFSGLLAEQPNPAIKTDASAAGQPLEMSGQRCDGSVFPLEATFARSRIGARELTVVVGVDLTARRRAADAERLQAAALNAAANSIMITMASGTITWVNPAFTGMTGYTTGEAVNRTPRLLSSGRQDPAFYTAMRTTIDRGEVWNGELVNRRKSGTLYTADMTIAPVRDTTGIITHFVTICQDITGRKQTELRLREYANALEVNAARLDQALEKSQQATVAKSQFLATMSHELRTPLNAVIAFAGLLLKNRRQHFIATELDYLERIRKNGNHLLGLINGVLDLSKIEAGKLEAQFEPVDLAGLVREVASQLEASAKLKGLTLQAELPDAMAPLTTDGPKLKQVLINLVGNALKFTGQGGITITVAGGTGGQPQQLAVSDTGIGIPADKLVQIFAAFQQADTSTTRRFGGTGLGLAILQQLCQLLGYDLRVTSRLQHGSTFTVDFAPVALVANG